MAIPGIRGAWNSNPYSPSGTFYSQGYLFTPNASMPFDLYRSLFSQNEYDDTAWYDANRPNSVAAAKKHFNDLIRDRLKNSKPCNTAVSALCSCRRLGDVSFQPNDSGGFNYSADISLIDKLGAEGKYVEAMPGYARDFVTAVFGPSREYVSGHWQISGTTQ